MLARVWVAVIGARRSGGVITRSSSCCCGWGCVVARWPACGLMTSTGGPVSWWLLARVLGRTCCRCRPMWARRSPHTCATVGRTATGGRCSCDPKRRMSRSLPGRSPRPCAGRAGIAEFGSHRLRHTAACEMVQANVPLLRIGQVLRHRSLQSTAIYARVDVERLRLLAPPWPGGAPR